MNTDQADAVRRAAKLLGSQRALAIALGVAPVNVSQWLSSTSVKGRPVPPKQCVRIEALTAKAVTRRDLRPTDWQDIWPELAGFEQKQVAVLAGQAQGATETVAQGAAHGH